MSLYTREKCVLHIDERIDKMRADYRKNGIPTILDESLSLLLTLISATKPKEILEIGTAVGMSGICMLNASKSSCLTTIEKDEKCFCSARENFVKFGVYDRINMFFGDAGDYLRCSEKIFNFIFLDGAKARYYDYLCDIKRVLNGGGVLFADNVLFRGLVEKGKPPHGDMTIVRNMRAFIDDLTADCNFSTSLIDCGDGVLIAVKK